jgi:hypothetical protein
VFLAFPCCAQMDVHRLAEGWGISFMSLHPHMRMHHHLCMKESVSLVEITERALGVSINAAAFLTHLVAGRS